MVCKRKNNKRYYKKGSSVMIGNIFTKFNGFETLMSVIKGKVTSRKKRKKHNKTKRFCNKKR